MRKINWSKLYESSGLVISSILITVLLVSSFWLLIIQNRDGYLLLEMGDLQLEMGDLQLEISNLQTEKTNLLSQLDLYDSIIHLQENRTLDTYNLTQSAGSYALLTDFNLDFSGYLQIALNSTAVSPFVIVEYQYQNISFSFNKASPVDGNFYFVVLPCNISVYLGNMDSEGLIDHTAKITYYY